MFLLHKSKSPPKEKSNSTHQSRMAEAIRRKCHEARRELAGYLQKKTNKLSAGAKMCSLIAFCLIGSVMYLYTAVQSWQAPRWPRSQFVQIRFPLHRQPSARSREVYQNDSILQRIKIFHTYMDSLGRTNTGLMTHDSILRARPGLMDSIDLLENTLIK